MLLFILFFYTGHPGMWLQGLNVSTFLKAPMYSMIQYLSCPTSWHHWTWKQHKTGGLFNFCYPALFWLMGPFSLLSTSAKPDLEALTLSFNWHKMQWEKRKLIRKAFPSSLISTIAKSYWSTVIVTIWIRETNMFAKIRVLYSCLIQVMVLHRLKWTLFVRSA